MRMTNKSGLMSFLIAVLLSSVLCGCSGYDGDVLQIDPAVVQQYLTAASGENISSEPDESVEETTDEPEESDAETAMPELEETEYDMSEYDEENGYMVFECHRNSFFCDGKSKELFPQLAGTLERIDEEEERAHKQEKDKFLEDARIFAKKSYTDGYDWHYMYYSESALQFADDRAVSILRTEYGYLGGAHPDYFYECINLNSQTGEEILLSDLIKDKEGLNKILREKLIEMYPDGNFFDLDESLERYDLDGVPEGDEITPYIFTMTPAGLTFYFDPYALNSYADGDQQVDVFFTDIPELLQDDFIFPDYEEEGRGDLID